MLVESDEFAENLRRQSRGKNCVRRTIALEYAMWNEPIRGALRLYLLRGLSERQRFRLGEDVGQENVMVAAKRFERLPKRDEVTRDESRALVNQLIEGVLTVRPGLAPINGARLIGDLASIDRNVLSVAFHRQLLQVRWKSF